MHIVEGIRILIQDGGHEVKRWHDEINCKRAEVAGQILEVIEVPVREGGSVQEQHESTTEHSLLCRGHASGSWTAYASQGSREGHAL